MPKISLTTKHKLHIEIILFLLRKNMIIELLYIFFILRTDKSDR